MFLITDYNYCSPETDVHKAVIRNLYGKDEKQKKVILLFQKQKYKKQKMVEEDKRKALEGKILETKDIISDSI